jgi:hypothetical protein
VLTPWPKAPQKRSGGLPQHQEVPDESQFEPALPKDVTACLGERLRTHYAQLVNEPVPDDLLRILETLNRTGRAGNAR